MKKVISLVLLLVLLSGCTPGTSIDLITNLSSVPSPCYMEEQLNNILKVEANVDLKDTDLHKVSVLPCNFQILDTSTALELLCSDETIMSHEMTSTEGIGPNAEQDFYRFESGAMLISGNTLCCYSTASAEKIFEIFGDNIETKLSDESQRENEFAFSSRQNIEKNILQLCAQFEIKANRVEICAVDYQSAQKEDQQEKYTWDERDNFYYVSVYPACGELPVSAINHGDLSDGSYVVGSSIRAIYSQEGLIYWNADFLFQPVAELTVGTGIISVQTAMNSIKEKYDLLLTSATYTITGIELVYLPVRRGRDAFELRPVWQFMMVEDNDKEEATGYFINIDATSGKEIR